jgi:translation initiation factor 2B subunit (eIF-2B alpha/beta/delta family)
VAEAIRSMAVRGAPAWDRGRLAEVWVDETRPLLQGARLTAWELRRAGIPFRVIADSAAGGLMARGLVDRVVVGADRIAANGDVANKVGTYPLAVLAARHGVPFYVAAPISTIDPRTPSGDRIPIEERDPAELGSTPVAFNGTKRSTSGRFFGFRGATRAGTTTTSQAAPSTSSRARSRNTCCVLRSPRAARGIRPAPRSGSRRRTSSHHLRGARAWS